MVQGGGEEDWRRTEGRGGLGYIVAIHSSGNLDITLHKTTEISGLHGQRFGGLRACDVGQAVP